MSRRVAGIALLVGVALLAACGGGGTKADVTPPPPPPVDNTLAPRLLTWSPPAQFTDNTTLDPGATLKEYEIRVRQDNNFSAADPFVTVDALTLGASPTLVVSYDLRNAYAPLSLSKGRTYYVSMRAVTNDVPSVISGFSIPSEGFTFD